MKGFQLLGILLLAWVSCFGQHRFIENKGQWPADALYGTSVPNGRVYLEKNALTFDLFDEETVQAVFGGHRGEKPIKPPKELDCHAYKLILEGSASDGVNIEGKDPFETKYAFYLSGREGKNAKAFHSVIYTDIYPSIDLKIHSRENLKYDFIVKPGGHPEDISLRYDGVKPELKRSGELLISTAVGQVMESAPFAYQVIDGAIVRIDCAFKISEGSIVFDLGSYDQEYDLIIDPELIFSTYSGSLTDNFGYTATFDIDGHLYSGSTAFGTQYPITMGAYQAGWAGGVGAGSIVGTDMAISKFNLEGTDLEYSTYLGGSGDELPHSLITDSAGVLYILGTTGSNNFPVTDDAVQTEFQGGSPTLLGGIGIDYNQGADIVVSALSADGQDLLASTYIGGTGNDGTNTAQFLKYNYADEVRGEIELDIAGNILVGSCTASEDFPVTSGALQTVKGVGQDGVFFALNPSMTELLASTFIGGNGGDAVYSIYFAPDGTVSLGGGTTSSDLPIPEGAFQPDNAGGNADGFIITIDEFAQDILNGTYWGTDAYDQVYFVERDGEGSPHVFGQTESTGSSLLFNADYGEPGQGMFVSKLGNNLETAAWSTTFGNQTGTPPLSPVAFAVDICSRIYLSGWGGSVNSQGNTFGLEVTGDALQSTTDGSDFYFMVLDGDADGLTFASFYGGNLSAEHVDGGTSRFDRGGKIYQAVCAGCGGNDDFPIAPPNALSPTNNSPNCNLGVAKIDFDLPLVLAGFEAEDVCLPSPVSFINTSETFSEGDPSYQWTFPNGDQSTEENPEFLFEEPGVYEVELIITDPLACNLADTLVQTVEVFSEIQLDVPDQIISCDSSTFEIEALTGGTGTFFTWAEDLNFTEIILEGETDSILNYTATGPTTIYLEVDNGLCNEIRPIFLGPPIDVELSFTDTLLCNVDTIDISFEVVNGWNPEDILWIPQDLVISGQGSPTATFVITEPFNISVLVENEFGCVDGPKATIESYDISLDAPSDTLLCTNDPLLLTANSFGTALEFLWSDDPDFGSILNPSGDSTISVNPGSIAFYYVQVDNNGCTLTDTVAVSLLEAGTSITPNQYICFGDTATIFVTNDFPGSNLTHEWEPDELILSGAGTALIQAIITEPVTFTVVSTTEDGCTVENQSTVIPSPLGGETVEAMAEPSVLTTGETSQLSVIPINEEYFYQWEPPDFLSNPFLNNPTSTPEETITYVVTITDIDDAGICQKSDTVVIQVFDAFCGSPNIFVPNAFTPNGDGENDLVLVRGGGITDLKFSIYNRWGEEVFYTEDQSVGWDGTYKGDVAEPAVFVYYLEAVCDDGQTYFEKGNITLIR